MIKNFDIKCHSKIFDLKCHSSYISLKFELNDYDENGSDVFWKYVIFQK